MPEDEKRFVVRMPASIHQWLTSQAKENERSLNSEIIQTFKELKKEAEKKDK